MILFSQRHKLGELFEKYCKENSVLNCPESMATWLYSLGLLNEEKVKDYLKENNDGQGVRRIRETR